MRIRQGTRSFVTLIEILLVLALIGIVGAVVSVNVSASMGEQSYLSSVQSLVERFRTAQDILIGMGADVEVHIEEEGGHYRIYTKSSGEIPKPMREALEKRESLAGISEIRIDGDPIRSTVVHFYARGNEVPALSFAIEASKEDQVRYLHLAGFPHPISASRVSESPFAAYRMERESREMYPREVRSE